MRTTIIITATTSMTMATAVVVEVLPNPPEKNQNKMDGVHNIYRRSFKAYSVCLLISLHVHCSLPPPCIPLQTEG